MTSRQSKSQQPSRSSCIIHHWYRTTYASLPAHLYCHYLSTYASLPETQCLTWGLHSTAWYQPPSLPGDIYQTYLRTLIYCLMQANKNNIHWFVFSPSYLMCQVFIYSNLNPQKYLANLKDTIGPSFLKCQLLTFQFWLDHDIILIMW